MHASLDQLIRKLARLPGLAPVSPTCCIIFIEKRDRLMVPLAQDLFDVASQVRPVPNAVILTMATNAAFAAIHNVTIAVFVWLKMLAIYGRWNEPQSIGVFIIF